MSLQFGFKKKVDILIQFSIEIYLYICSLLFYMFCIRHKYVQYSSVGKWSVNSFPQLCSSLSKYSHSHCRPLVTEMLPFWDFFLNAFLYGQSSNNTTKNNPKLWSCSVWVLYIKSPIGQLKSVKQVVTVHEIRLFIVLFKGQSHKIRCNYSTIQPQNKQFGHIRLH